MSVKKRAKKRAKSDGVISENKSKTFTEIEKMPLRDYIEMCKKKLVGRS